MNHSKLWMTAVLHWKKLFVTRQSPTLWQKQPVTYKHTQQDKLTPQRETALSLWKEIGRHSTQPHGSSGPDVIEGASCRPGVCSPPYAGVWAVPQVRLKLTFGNIYQDCVHRQLVEDRFCWQDIIYGCKWDILLGCLVQTHLRRCSAIIKEEGIFPSVIICLYHIPSTVLGVEFIYIQRLFSVSCNYTTLPRLVASQDKVCWGQYLGFGQYILGFFITCAIF